MSIQQPKLPYFKITLISVFFSALLTRGISFETLTAMLDFLGIITPILFTAFGIWIGIIDPSKILLTNNTEEGLNTDDSIIYQLCYYLMCCTGALITIIVLKFTLFTYSAWKPLLFYLFDQNIIYLIIVLKYCITSVVTFLYCSILWISCAILAPLIIAMKNYKKVEQDNRIIGENWKVK